MNVVNKTVFHKAYGKGIVKEHNGGKITVDFSGTEKLFFIPDSFEKGFLSTEDEEFHFKNRINGKPKKTHPWNLH